MARAVSELPAVATFFNPRYPHELFMDRNGEGIATRLKFEFGRLTVFSEEDAQIVRDKLVPRGYVFEGRPDDGVRCPLCADKGRDPIWLNAKAMAEHMRITHGDSS